MSTALSAIGAAQAPPDTMPGPHDLPRFTLREMVIARNDSVVRLPGPWVRAATLAFPESAAVTAYTTGAARIPLAPLGPRALATERSQHVMGLYGREELVAATRRTLASIRAALPADSTRVRFDAIFKPQGEWVVDIHDAAFAWARARSPSTRWTDAWSALLATHWVSPSDTAMMDEALPRALYGIAALAETDSTAYATVRRALWQADSTSASKVFALLEGYTQAKQWYVDALSFFLSQPWLPDHGGMSVRDLVGQEWGAIAQPVASLGVPAIQPRWFGYPQAVPNYGVPPRLLAHLVRLDNPEAVSWLEHQGQAGLLRSIKRLPLGDSTLLLLQTRSETLRLTTAARHARESLNGFLEPADAIAIDPGYSPLLALGAVVHEWQHLLFRREQLERVAANLGKTRPSVLALPGIEPHVAEGFAEWSAERILRPIVQRWPLFALGELEKRAALSQTSSNEEHTLGYALVRTLAAAVADAPSTTRLLLRYADAPVEVMREPVLRKAWQGYHGAPDLRLRQAGLGLLLPEVTFTIEDGQPDVVSTRILLPPADDQKH